MAVLGIFAAISLAAGAGQVPGPTPAEKKEAPPETTFVFVPYDKAVGPQFGPGESVLLPYAEFLRLKNTGAQPADPRFNPIASLSRAVYKGEIEGLVVRLEAEFTIEALAREDDRLEIRLPFDGASIESASMEGSPGHLAPSAKGLGMQVFLQGGGKRTLNVVLVAPLSSDGAVKRMDFSVPRTAAASVVLRVKEDVALAPEPNQAPAAIERLEDGSSEIRASIGSQGAVRLAFRPRVTATGAATETRLSVEQDLRVQVSLGAANVQAKMKVSVLAGAAKSLRLRLPSTMRLLNVSGPFVRDWSNPGAERQVTVSLVREVADAFDLTIDAQIDSSDTAHSLIVPEIRVPDAVRETGLITISPDSGLSIWPEVAEGLETVAPQTQDGAGARAYRFAQPGWRMALSRHLTPARVRSQGIILYEVTEEFVRLKSRHNLSISGRGIFGVVFETPKGFELSQAGPPALVSGFRQSDGRVEINFRSEQLNGCEVQLSLQRPRTAAENRPADGGAWPLTLGPVRVAEADEDAGSIVLAAPRALRATEVKAESLEATDVRVLQQQLANLLSPDLIPVLGYRYFTPNFSFTGAIERQKTRVTCETELLASVMPKLMSVEAVLNYNVEFSTADRFELLVPASAGEAVRFSGADIKEKTRSEPASAEDELTTWTIRLQQPVLGGYSLGVSFDQPLPEAESGKPLEVAVPTVRAANVARETGHLGVSRGENLEVSVAKSDGLEPRDVKELPPALASAFLGFRYFDPDRRALTLKLLRHEIESVLGALIRRMHVETVLSDQREAVHEVTFEIQNNREQYLELDLPKNMEIWSAFVQGAPTPSTTRQDDGVRLIELSKSDSRDAAFRVRMVLRETLPGGEMGARGRLRFDPPKPLNIPVLRMSWKLFLPDDYVYVDFDGTMEQQAGEKPPWKPVADKILADLPAQVAGGVARERRQAPNAQPQVIYDSAETPEEKKARMQGAALEIPIVREGLQYHFSLLSGVGDIRVTYWEWKPLLLFQGAVAILIFAILLAAMGVGKRPVIGFGALIAFFIAASLLEGLGALLCYAAISGSALALAVALIAFLIKHSGASLRFVSANSNIPPTPLPEASEEEPPEDADSQPSDND